MRQGSGGIPLALRVTKSQKRFSRFDLMILARRYS
nr:MAG TPA: hypothetical protein [Caudoviricetes sp.]